MVFAFSFSDNRVGVKFYKTGWRIALEMSRPEVQAVKAHEIISSLYIVAVTLLVASFYAILTILIEESQ